jgi:DNA-binding NtrC family response regulator
MTIENRQVLIYGEDKALVDAVSSIIDSMGGNAVQVFSIRDTFKKVIEKKCDALLIDSDLKENQSLEIIKKIKKKYSSLPVVILVSPASLSLAMKALKFGSDDYLLKPLDPDEFRKRLGRIFQRFDLNFKVSYFQEEFTKRHHFKNLVAHSEEMKSLLIKITRIAPMKSTVLILGESGVGKELVARAIHFGSPRNDKPFIPLNCSAMPEYLIESELFGHEKGSFTGAYASAKGKFEIGDGGTIFLDEVGEMNLSAQVKLLRIIEEKEFMRVGGNQSIKVDVRLIAATNTDLDRRVSEGKFRKDLLYRLKVLILYVPPLRERIEDIPDLIHIFMDEVCKINNIRQKSISWEAIEFLKNYSWPGNVRELKNFLESIIVSTPGDTIHEKDIPHYINAEKESHPKKPSLQPGMTVKEMEKDLIKKTLDYVHGNRTKAAKMLDIGLRTLQRKIKAYKLK